MNDQTVQPKTTIHKQLLEAQKETGVVLKDANNPFFKSKYADLNSIMGVAKPALNKHGLYISHHMTENDNQYTIITRVTNEEGESLECLVPVFVKAQNDPQALGSAITYARRYGLSALLAIETEDDDGNAANRKPKEVFREKITQVQIKAIGDLMKVKGVGKEQLSDLAGGKSANEMMKDEADNLIYYLKKQPDASPEVKPSGDTGYTPSVEKGFFVGEKKKNDSILDDFERETK